MPVFSRTDDRNRQETRKALESAIGADTLAELERLIQQERAIPPKVAVIGKAGVGKTTTINNLFNVTWKTSHTIAGTTSAQVKEFALAGGGKLMVVDMPGLGEDLEADIVFEQIYGEVLPTVDIVLYVIQANARDLAEDERILKDVVLHSMKGLESRVVVGLNQVDKIGPGRRNLRLNFPSAEQQKSIERRCNDIIRKLHKFTQIQREHIVYYSALRRFRLYDVLIAVITAAGNLGWKFPIQPKDPFELADPEVQEFVSQVRAQRGY